MGKGTVLAENRIMVTFGLKWEHPCIEVIPLQAQKGEILTKITTEESLKSGCISSKMHFKCILSAENVLFYRKLFVLKRYKDT